MASITIELTRELQTVRRPGDFYATGTAEFLAPRLEVEGVGPIALPLLDIQARQLVEAAERAPYGRGQDTLVDTGVRRTWQIDAGRVRIEGKHWAGTLDGIVARVADGLGVAGPVEVELYKLLVYDAGSFFISHRDTEKAPGMFATLVIVLPSLYTGGELIVRHRDREVRLDLASSDPSDVAFAAFYADCVHEVRPVVSGCRLALIYNLTRRGGLPTPPDYSSELARVAGLLRSWGAAKNDPEDESPEKLVYALEHGYTPAELSFATLKGADAAVAAVLAGAAEPAGCDLHLALVSIEESGGAEHSGDGGWYDNDDDFEIVEVCDRYLTLSDWRSPDGGRPELAEFPFEEEELCPPEAFEGLEPDELHFHEATGNEGASFERTYRRAGLVLWPKARRLAVLNQVGLGSTLPYLGQLARTWSESGEDQDAPLWREAHELAGHMLRTWPLRDGYEYGYGRDDDTPGQATAMLGALVRLRDTARIEEFLAEIVADGVYGKADNAAVLEALGLLPPERAAELIEGIVAGNAVRGLGACANLLALATTARPGLGLVPAAVRLLVVLPGDPERAATAEPRRRPASVEPAAVADLLAALARIDGRLADRMADHVLAWPALYGPDAVLVPALLRLAEAAPDNRDSPAVRRLAAATWKNPSAAPAPTWTFAPMPMAAPIRWSAPRTRPAPYGGWNSAGTTWTIRRGSKRFSVEHAVAGVSRPPGIASKRHRRRTAAVPPRPDIPAEPPDTMAVQSIGFAGVAADYLSARTDGLARSPSRSRSGAVSGAGLSGRGGIGVLVVAGRTKDDRLDGRSLARTTGSPSPPDTIAMDRKARIHTGK